MRPPGPGARIDRLARLAFMAAVTAAALAMTFEHALGNGTQPFVLAVYALVTGFGLEFVRSEWAAGTAGDRGARAHRP